MRRSMTPLVAAVILAVAGPLPAQTLTVPPDVTVPALAPNAEVRPIALTRLVIKMPQAKVWSDEQVGMFCAPRQKLTWVGGMKDVKSADFVETFRSEMRKAGFKVDGDSSNLFEQQTPSTSDYQVGGMITNVDLQFCLPRIGFGDASTVHGVAVMDVEWQIYSTFQKTILAKVETTGGMELKKSSPGGSEALLVGALSQNVRALAAADAFRKIFIGAPAASGEVARPMAQSVIPLAGALASAARPIADAVGAVVMIFAGQSQGSGFLVSTDGMLLTDRHVVGDAKFVKVRWPDGIEALGEVVRSDKVRDVALVKSEPRGRRPLKIRRDPPQPGDPVFAIGAPLDIKLQNTVTRGIVSANRVFDGLSYIQSDVSVNPGSSGGPLMDEKGDVIGVTESGVRIGSAPQGINLFTPIGDALDFLSAQPR